MIGAANMSALTLFEILTLFLFDNVFPPLVMVEQALYHHLYRH